MNAPIRQPVSVGYSELLSNFAAVEKMATAICQSGMFGCQDREQATIVAMDCIVRGIPLLEYQQRNHMIMGKPSMKYDAMLADYDRLPGRRHVVVEKTDERAVLLLIHEVNGEEIEREYSLTWEAAQKEPFVYVGKESKLVEMLASGQTPPLKDKYATPRSRSQMLFARVVSDAVRSEAPEVTAGRYTPEEIEDFSDVVDGSAKVVTQAATAIEQTEVSPETIEDSANTAKEAPATKTAEATNTLAGKTEISTAEPLTVEQETEIKQLILTIKQQTGENVAVKIKEILTSKGLAKLADLSISSAQLLIQALQAKQLEAWAASEVEAHTGPN